MFAMACGACTGMEVAPRPVMDPDLVIRHVQLGSGAPAQPPVDIVVRGGAIAAIAPAAGANAAFDAVHCIDGRGLLAFPGFVNAHAHSNESFEQGAYDGEPLETWHAMAYPPLADEALPARWHYLRAMLLAMLSLRSGVTAVHDDLLNPAGDPEVLAQVLAAYRDAGLRARVAVTLVDRGYLDGLPLAAPLWPPELRALLAARHPRALADQVAFAQEALAQVRISGDPRVQLSLGPRGPQRCTPDLLRTVAALADRHGVPVHMHVLETRAQALAAHHQYGHSFVRVLDEAGLLDERLALVHAVWLTADDIARVARSGARVVHNPLSNCKLESGLCPVKRLLAAGVDVALGTDGAATGDSLDFFDTLRLAALLHKLDADPALPAPSAPQLLRMASAAGAATLGGAGIHGELQVGQRADITLLDASDPAWLPLNDGPRQLCYAANSRSVHTVIVDGSVVHAQGRCTRFDEAALRAEIADAAREFRQRRLQRAMPDAVLPPLRAMARQARAQSRELETVNRVVLP